MARQKLIHLHGTGELKSVGTGDKKLNLGEIAVRNAAAGVAQLYITDDTGNSVVAFMDAQAVMTADAVNAAAIKTISDDYLKKADKTALQGEIDAAEDRIAALEGKFEGDDSVAAQIEAAVAAEAEIARAAEKANADAIKTISDDYLKAADKEALQDAIDAKVAQSAYDTKVAALEDADEANAKAITAHTTNGDIHVTAQQKTDWQAATDAIKAFMDAENVGDEVVDTLKEIQDYINTDGKAADAMTKNIAANAAAIDAIEADYLKAADKEALQGAIDAKVAQSAYDTKVAALEQADATNAKAISDETTRAEAAEAGLQAAIDAIAGENGSLADTLQAAKDYTNGLLGEGFSTGNTVSANVKANADAIDAIEADYLKAADKEALQGAIDAKVAQSAYDTKVAALEQADTDMAAAIKALEDADYVKSVSVASTTTNGITATVSEGAVTLNFDGMVIDCGAYEA